MKKLFTIFFLALTLSLSFFIPLDSAEAVPTLKIGEQCEENDQCISGHCEESNIIGEDGKNKWYCDCHNEDSCINEYSPNERDTPWSCIEGSPITYDLDFCRSNAFGTKYAVTPGDTQSDVGGTTKAADDLIKSIGAPVTKISIPGVDFSDVGVEEEGGQSILKIPFLGDYIAAIYQYGLILGGLASVMIIIIAGFTWTTSGGNPSIIDKAKGMISKAILGLILLASSYTILNFINPELIKLGYLSVPYITTEKVTDIQRDFASTGGISGKFLVGTCVDSYVAPKIDRAPITESLDYIHYGVFWGFSQKQQIMKNIKELDIVDFWGTSFRGGNIVGNNFLNSGNFSSTVTEIRQKNPDAKIIFSLIRLYKGDVNRTILRQGNNYAKNVSYTVEMIKKYDLDGVSINFEFPSGTTNPKVTKEQTTQFFKDFRRDVEAQVGKKILLSFYAPNATRYAVDFAAVSNEVDYLTPMTYGIYRDKDKYAGPYLPVLEGEPFFKRYTLVAFLKMLNEKIPQSNWDKIIITTGAWPATKFSGTTKAEPGTTFSVGKYKPHTTYRREVTGAKVCLHPSGSKYAQIGNSQYWFEDYESFMINMSWAKTQIQQGRMGGFYEWSTNLMDSHYWAAIQDTF